MPAWLIKQFFHRPSSPSTAEEVTRAAAWPPVILLFTLCSGFLFFYPFPTAHWQYSKTATGIIIIINWRSNSNKQEKMVKPPFSCQVRWYFFLKLLNSLAHPHPLILYPLLSPFPFRRRLHLIHSRLISCIVAAVEWASQSMPGMKQSGPKDPQRHPSSPSIISSREATECESSACGCWSFLLLCLHALVLLHGREVSCWLTACRSRGTAFSALLTLYGGGTNERTSICDGW